MDIIILVFLFLNAQGILSITLPTEVSFQYHQIAGPKSRVNCLCGSEILKPRKRSEYKKYQFRVVGGKAVKSQNYPQIVGLFYGRFRICGTTIVNNSFILAAAHCVYKLEDLKQFNIKFGKHDLTAKERKKLRIGVKTVTIHELYNDTTLENDVAVLQLTLPINSTSDAKPMCGSFRISNRNRQLGTSAVWNLIKKSSTTGNSDEIDIPINYIPHRGKRKKKKKTKKLKKDDSIFTLTCVLPGKISDRKPQQKFTIDVTSDAVCGCVKENGRRQFLGDDPIMSPIVGGQPTIPHAYPQVVYMQYRKKIFGGTIINKNYILTAAHCVINRNILKSYKVKIGKYNLIRPEAYDKKLSVKKIIIHPDYNKKNFDNDIAILQISSPITFNRDVKPTCLPLSIKNYENETAIAVGWGIVREDKDISEILQQVALPILTKSLCKFYYGFIKRNFDSMFCAGYPEGGKDTCQGDSGGPIFLNSTSPPTQVGVISFGDGCARPNGPGVYADVGYNMKFIIDNTKVKRGCQIYSHDKEIK